MTDAYLGARTGVERDTENLDARDKAGPEPHDREREQKRDELADRN